MCIKVLHLLNHSAAVCLVIVFFYTHSHIPVAVLGLLGLPDPFPHFFSTPLFHSTRAHRERSGAETTSGVFCSSTTKAWECMSICPGKRVFTIVLENNRILFSTKEVY